MVIRFPIALPNFLTKWKVKEQFNEFKRVPKFHILSTLSQFVELPLPAPQAEPRRGRREGAVKMGMNFLPCAMNLLIF